MRGLIVAAVVCATAGAAWGQDQVQRLERSLRQAQTDYQLRANPALSLNERVLFEYGGLLTFAFLAIDDVQQETHILRETDAQFFGRISIDGAHEFYGRLRFTYDDFNTGDDFDGRGDHLYEPIGDRWWYQFDLRRAIEASEGLTPDYNVRVKIGRQFVDWASGIVLSDQLYAVRVGVELGDFVIEGLAGMTPSSSVIDIDSSRPTFDRDTDRNFFGGMLTWTGLPGHAPYAYGLVQRDMNDEDFTTISLDAGGGLIIPAPTRFRYDSWYVGVGSTGELLPRLLYTVEVVYQGGSGLSNSASPAPAPTPLAQTTEDIEAWAARLELAYVFRDASQTRLEFEVIAASGDDDRDLDTSNTFGGNESGTDDNAFNAFGFAKTGLSFAAPISNLLMFRAGASAFPLHNTDAFSKLQLGIDVFWFNKLDADAPFDEPTDGKHYLGFETDVFAAWRITSDMAINVRYGVFFPGTAVSEDHDARHFFYGGVSYSF